MEKTIKYLKKFLPSARFKHTLGTLRIARVLAKKYNISEKKVIDAALLHDIGRGLTKNAMINYVKRNKINVPELKNIIKYNPLLLHGFISADLAKKRFNIKDKEVLKAISLHTIAGPNMSKLDKIIYLADITAPDRRYKHVKKIRRQSMHNISKAMHLAMKSKISHVLKGNKWLHPNVLKAWNENLG